MAASQGFNYGGLAPAHQERLRQLSTHVSNDPAHTFPVLRQSRQKRSAGQPAFWRLIYRHIIGTHERGVLNACHTGVYRRNLGVVRKNGIWFRGHWQKPSQ